MATGSTFLQNNKSSPLLGFEAVVDLSPERAEIVHCGNQGEENNHIESDGSCGVKLGKLVAQNQKGDGGNLGDHLDLPQFGSFDRKSLRRSYTP